MKPDITEYTLSVPAERPVTFAVVADLHNKPYSQIMEALREKTPDAILAVGDIIERDPGKQADGRAFLTECARLRPTFYAFGNHETGMDEALIGTIPETGVKLLRNASVHFGEWNIGGLGGELTMDPDSAAFLDRFAREDGKKILLCHEPDRYYRYGIAKYGFPVIVSGHAHGGQIRVFGQGLYAPGQGIFPKYTAGVHGGCHVISRGLANHEKLVPRLWNHPELVYFTVGRR